MFCIFEGFFTFDKTVLFLENSVENAIDLSLICL